MRKSTLLATTMIAALASGCTTMNNEGMATTTDTLPGTVEYNPDIPEATSVFAELSPLYMHAPQFDQIEDSDWQGIIEEAMAIQLAEVEAIANNPNEPTFANTLVAMEESGQVFARAYGAFSQVVSANINDTIAATDEALAPQVASMYDSIYLNPELFARVKAVYDNRAAMAMTPEDAMLLETTYEEFVHRGALLGEAQQAELRQINERLSSLSAQISQRITTGQNNAAIVVDTREQLSGLSEGQIESAAALAAESGHEGHYMLNVSNTSGVPQLAQLDNRDVRERLYKASISRNQTGEASTLPLIQEVISLRNRRAQLFGEPTHANWQMYDRMVADPQAAINFMAEMVPALRATQEREAAVLQERIEQDGHDFQLAPWDWQYYASKVRAERYALDNEEIKQYFVVDNVLEDGVFYMAEQLYGLTFEERTDIPTYHPDVKVYTVFHDGEEQALFYFDPFSRESKRGGAWMSNFIEQSHLLGLKPVITNTQNIAPPAPGQPALATWDDVTTMFHEFGHALHGIFADQQYPSLSGTNTARDWVEFPSQFHENFAAVPEVLQRYARHHETGEVIPDELVQAIDRASKFNQGHSFGEIIAASLLDMEWHSLDPSQPAPTDVMAFEEAALERIGLRSDLVPPRYRTPYFRHIFEHGYDAGYYAYTWTEMLHHDAYSYVANNGGMTREMGDHIIDSFLGQGHSKTYEQMFRDFTGRDPQVEPLLEARGLIPEDDDVQGVDGAEGAV
ncbi:M3 family metallopeptidase [Aurantiacibacter poecillastricola]|uniref:M3 family metallopeptidase n=1 Tax=Aurantiacibacter poecillastricola TaxID=3064385 RepID=UPI00273D8BEB|nr:M3 family metallopeptidase [Aurantiacibacter sp. 219JJ12-13]MDP5261653.1 M3 family metallopeptidase [Aurantiacibacter sp. 219JJ12-13]